MQNVIPQQDLVVVLGMHRSGTSLCANMLHALGVDMAEAPGAGPHNQRGHWERARINDLNDQVLAALSRRWNDDAHVLALPPGWLDDARVQAVRAELVAWLPNLLKRSQPAGFKDPRTARLMPLWQQVFATLNVRPRFVLCVRNPAQVARSLAARDRMAREKAEYRWLVYNADAVLGVAHSPVCVVPYEDWFIQPAANAARLADFLDLAEPPPDLVQQIVDADLRHDSAVEAAPPAMARRLHRLITRAAELGHFDPDALAFCACLTEFERLVQPMLVEAEVLRASVVAQNRVIADLNTLVTQLRTAA